MAFYDGLLQLAAWARDGLTNEQIANNVGITATTLYEWINRYPEISEALKRGKAIVDIVVENALLKRALGYDSWSQQVLADLLRDCETLFGRTRTHSIILKTHT